MGLDGALIAMVVGGMGLSIAYLAAEYLHWRAQGAADRRREALQRELHAARLAQHEAAQSPSKPPAAEKIADALPDRRTAPAAAHRVYPFVDRRKRASSRGGSIGTSP
jgi:hypothetical protein